MQRLLFDRTFEEQNGNDVVLTPEWVAKNIVEPFAPSGRCLDPCKGDGAFFKHLPAGSDFCELKDDKDFFNWTEPVDWIVSNPPYSIFNEWIDHSFHVAENVVYLLSAIKPWGSFSLLKKIHQYGGMKEIYVLGTGSSVGFPFGFPLVAI